MFSFLWWLIIGLIAGALARLILPGKDPMSLLATLVLGMAGSIIGGFVSSLIWGSDSGFRRGGLLLSFLGAVFALWIWRMIRSRTTVQ